MADERVIPGETPVPNLVKHIARYNMALPYCDGKMVLDAACGAGYGSKMLSWVAQHVDGWDISNKALTIARERFGGTNIDYTQANLTMLDTPWILNKHYQAIVCFETVEHLSNIAAWEKAVNKMLLPGGKLIYSVPLYEEPGWNEHHRHVFDVKGAGELFSQLDLVHELVQIDTNFYLPEKVPETIKIAARSYYLAVKEQK